jgi:hypothetical protein
VSPELVEPTDAEDLKIINLARSALARTQARQGACVRDTDGRTYAAASVALPHLRLSAVGVAVAMAVSSGAAGLEAAAVAGDPPDPGDTDILRDLAGKSVPVFAVDAAGRLADVVRT